MRIVQKPAGWGGPVIRIQNVGANSQAEFVYWDGNFSDKFLIDDGDLLLTLSGSFRIDEWQLGQGLLNQRVVKLTPSFIVYKNDPDNMTSHKESNLDSISISLIEPLCNRPSESLSYIKH